MFCAAVAIARYEIGQVPGQLAGARVELDANARVGVSGDEPQRTVLVAAGARPRVRVRQQTDLLLGNLLQRYAETCSNGRVAAVASATRGNRFVYARRRQQRQRRSGFQRRTKSGFGRIVENAEPRTVSVTIANVRARAHHTGVVKRDLIQRSFSGSRTLKRTVPGTRASP